MFHINKLIEFQYTVTKSKSTAWLIQKMKMLQKNLLVIFNVILWLLILYFSIYEDKIAAFLSYVAAALTVLTIKLPFHGIISESTAYFVDILSKILILAGISLVILPVFWNAAFYSICLGIFMQRVKYEIVLIASSVQDFHEDMSDIHDEFKQFIQQRTVCEIAQDKIPFEEKEMQDSNEKSLSTISNGGNLYLFKNNQENSLSNKVKGHEKALRREIQTSGENFNKSKLEVLDTVNSNKETVILPVKNLQKDFFNKSSKDENVLFEIAEKLNSLKQDELILKQNKILLQSELEAKMKEVESLRVWNVKVLNLQDLALNESADVGIDTVNTELKRDAEVKCDVLEFATLNNGTLIKEKFPNVDNLKQSGTTSNISESTVENKVTNEIFHAEATIVSNNLRINEDYCLGNNQKNDFSIYEQNSCHQKEIKEQIYSRTVNTFKDNEHLLVFNDETEKEICSFNESVLKAQSLLGTNRNIDLKPEYENENCTPAETINVEFENETCILQKKIFEIVDRKNEILKSVSQNDSKLNQEHENNESKVVPNSSKILDLGDESKRNGSSIDEKNKTDELIKKKFRKVRESSSERISDVEDAVNKIDLSFIYDLGFKAPV